MPLEVERRFLLTHVPAPGSIPADAERVEIRQTYLRTSDGDAGGTSRRVRSWTVAGRTRWFFTEKRHVSSGVRDEREQELDAGSYAELLAEADPARRTVVKTRWRYPHGGRLVELDHVIAPVDVWLLEIELPDAADLSAPLELPPVGELVDVTDDPAYANAALATGRLPGRRLQPVPAAEGDVQGHRDDDHDHR